MSEVEYTKPTTQIDAELRLAEEEGKADRSVAGSPRSFAVEGNDLSGYVGVSPEYQNYADETHAPIAATEGVEVKLRERHAAAASTDLPKGVKAEGDRVEPKGASFSIPAEPNEGQPASAADDGGEGEGSGKRGGRQAKE